jgi:tetratricopeptide (TPR) repeat protein
MTRIICIGIFALAIVGCRSLGPYGEPPQAPLPQPAPQPAPAPPPIAEPEEPTPPAPPTPAPRQFRLSAASSALVTQARSQSASGDHALATATLERALRIEPDNPLLWIELGKVHEDNGNHVQADSMGRKALQLGRGDPAVQSAAWRLIADSLRSRGRNQEAAEADARASGAVPR